MLFICTQSALHVSGEVFAHHQELLTVFTASDIVHLCCCRPVSRTRWKWSSTSTGRQQHSWTISEAVNTVKYSWWWAKPSPETWRADWVQINKPKICIFVFISYELYDGFVLRIWATSFDISTWRLWIHLLPPCCSFEVKLISTNMLRPNPQNSI